LNAKRTSTPPVERLAIVKLSATIAINAMPSPLPPLPPPA
jgi:hypothetical protein